MSQSLDFIAPAFGMARDRWPDAATVQAHYADLAKTFEEDGSSLLELTNSFLEMVCKTVMKEMGGALPESHPTTAAILSSTLDALGLKAERGSSALGTIISGHNKLAKGLADARNQEGSVAHGKDGFLDSLSTRCARVYLLSADMVISLILSAYESVEPSILHTRERPDRYRHHNDKIDAGTAVSVDVEDDGVLVLGFSAGSRQEGEGVELRARPSELLYHLDREAYVDMLNEVRGVTPPVVEDDTDEAEVVPDEPTPTPEPEVLPPVEDAQPSLEPLATYEGKHADQYAALHEFLVRSLPESQDVDASVSQSFAATLLKGMEDLTTVDWRKRPSSQSAIRAFIKKLNRRFSDDELKPSAADEMLNWLNEHIDDEEEQGETL